MQDENVQLFIFGFGNAKLDEVKVGVAGVGKDAGKAAGKAFGGMV